MKTKLFAVAVALCAGVAFGQKAREPVDYNSPARFNGKPYGILVNGMVAEAGGGNVVIDGGVRINGAVVMGSTSNKGRVWLDGGMPTATVSSGSVCVCSDTTADGGTANAAACAVSSTTLYFTGTADNWVSYICL